MPYPKENEYVILSWLIIGLFLVFLISLAFLILLKANHKKHVDTKQKIRTLNQQHAEKLQRSSLDIQEKERQRIGSDLHDSVINSLNVLFLKSQMVQDEQILIDGIQETISLTRRISHGLNPPLLAYASLENLVKDLFQQWAIFYTLNIYINKQTILDLSTEQKMHILRIIQELINNVYKHAKASEIDFHLRLSNDSVAFVVRDNGRGFPTRETSCGLGIQNIQLRTTLLQATYKYKQNVSSGTTFIFVMPLKLNT
ncbi:sensor histidine kinase [Myroides sp. WP-1]|uniref:sensor histidine kinase n=1 Tax=Myroides sp. WP-1 TaxID=2759944 RepID=UPI0015FB27E4|nr:ATP-binding protein [Myroides sp. WP-1]MBB1139109.1 sensor histidine kinase [Myroides sp. WP-1]